MLVNMVILFLLQMLLQGLRSNIFKYANIHCKQCTLQTMYISIKLVEFQEELYSANSC